MKSLLASFTACGLAVIALLDPSAVAEPTHEVLHSFAEGPSSPQSNLVIGNDGNFYGTTPTSVFKVSPAGVLTALVEFTGNGASNKGNNPNPLVKDTDGTFYGTTSDGGANGFGTVFKMTPGGTLTTLVEFTGNGASNKGSFPGAALARGGDGNFYGTTQSGGADDSGTVFMVTPSGTLTTLVEFTGNGASNLGASPKAALLPDSDGNFYGTTLGGGADGFGTVFKMTPAGNLTTLVEFTGNGATNKGNSPEAALVRGNDSNFYGTTLGGGADGLGTVFKMTPAGNLTTLVEFTGNGTNNKGSSPSTLVLGSDGNFYGTTAGGGATDDGTVFQMTPAGTLTTRVEFTNNGATNRGGFSFSGTALVEGSDGNFYGTTDRGGTHYDGTIFKMTPSGSLTTLLDFTGNAATNEGHVPNVLVQGSDGNFYGTTIYGGASGYGTVFKMTPAGVLTELLAFTGNGASNKGSSPFAALVEGSDGNFYGTTGTGGAGDFGTVFKITPAGALTTLLGFTGNGGLHKGGYPRAPLSKGTDGNFYGTTSGGGAGGFGTVFKMTPAGVLTTLLDFTNNGATNKGASPEAELVSGGDGNFYGTTTAGGANGFGTIFKMTPAGTLTTLVEFTGNGATKGESPNALVQGNDGNFYGTTAQGGVTGDGTAFKMTPAGVLTTLAEFTIANGSSAPNHGEFPSSLVLAADGNFYGTTGDSDQMLFKMTPAGVLTKVEDFDSNETIGYEANQLVRGADGNLYGTTDLGGPGGGGTIFRLRFTQVDTLPPDTIIVSCPNGIIDSSTATLVFTSTEAGSTFVGSLDGEPEEPVTSPKTYLRLAPGDHTFTVRAIDRAGNADATPATCAWTVALKTIITSGPMGTLNSRRATFTFLSNVDGATFMGSLDGAPWTPVTSPKTYAGLSDGPHEFRVRATAGNVSEDPPVIRNWRVDTAVAPDTTITRGPTGIHNGGTATFTFSSDQVGATFLGSRDGAPETPVTSPTIFNSLSVGGHTFSVRAVFRGKSDPTPAMRSWTVSPGSPRPALFGTGDSIPGGGSGGGASARAALAGGGGNQAQLVGMGGAPADAKLTAFGVPAIDDGENVTFLGYWTSASTGNRRGIFTTTNGVTDAGGSLPGMSVAEVGGSVPGVPGATFATIYDPIIDDGNLGFLAALGGVPAANAAAVFSDAPNGTLEKVARAGDEAPNANGATFSRLQAVAVSGSSVAFLGKLKTGSGFPAVTDANSLGLWAQDASHPLTEVLRQGHILNGKRISRLVTFNVGNGSPGQGRGWLHTTESGSTQLLALALLSGRALAVLSADLDGTVTILSETGASGVGGPDIPRASFASYGMPAANGAGYSAFRARLTVGPGGVTTANADGIFLLTPPALHYSPVARTGDRVGTTGARFSAFQDPVLASDGGIAFPATITDANGISRQTLWWKPPGDTLRLVAQAGDAATLIAGGKWGAFQSLAIINGSGPIFTASYVAGTGATARTEIGAWAMDSTGKLQRLIRPGDLIGEKRVKSFNFLKAVPGSMGVTHGFNDSGEAIWRAHFTDNTSAVIVTTIP